MTRLLAQILLSIVVIVSAPLVFVISFVIIEDAFIRVDDEALLAAAIFSGLYLMVIWTWLWKGRISWTSARVRWTVVIFFVSLVGAAIVGWIIAEAVHDEVGVCLGSFTWMTLFLGLSVVAWRETGAERAERLQHQSDGTVFCQACGYNMTGLHEARCPECGNRYTLNELFASQEDDSL